VFSFEDTLSIRADSSCGLSELVTLAFGSRIHREIGPLSPPTRAVAGLAGRLPRDVAMVITTGGPVNVAAASVDAFWWMRSGRRRRRHDG
jgi:hypothetical protein